MGATRLASGIFQQPRDASPPLVLAFLQCVSGNFPQNVLSKKSILNTQPCGSVFEFAPTDNRHEVTVIGVCALHVLVRQFHVVAQAFELYRHAHQVELVQASHIGFEGFGCTWLKVGMNERVVST